MKADGLQHHPTGTENTRDMADDVWQAWGELTLQDATQELSRRHPGVAKQRIRAALKRCIAANPDVTGSERVAFLVEHYDEYQRPPRSDELAYQREQKRNYMRERRARMRAESQARTQLEGGTREGGTT